MGWVVHVICVGRRRNACDICGQDEKCMWYVWAGWEMHAKSAWKTEANRPIPKCVEWWIILKWILQKWGVRMWIWSIWLSIGTYQDLVEEVMNFWGFSNEAGNLTERRPSSKRLLRLFVQLVWSNLLKRMAVSWGFNPLLLLFKALLHGQKDCVFFSRHLKCIGQQERFRAFRLARNI
jgi:hypothetical protein